MDKNLEKEVLEKFKLPLKYSGQYIFDDNGNMAAQVRGWGYLQYYSNAVELQDTLGEMIAASFNEKYTEKIPARQRRYIEITHNPSGKIVGRADVTNANIIDIFDTLEVDAISKRLNIKKALVFSNVPLDTFNIDSLAVEIEISNINA